MKKRVCVEKEVLEKVRTELKSDGYTLDDISDEIGCSFRNCLYNGTSLDLDSFSKLESTYGDSIGHEVKFFIDGSGFQEPIESTKNGDLAELVGYLLGDGCISAYTDEAKNFSNYYVAITLHEDEIEQIETAQKLFEDCLDENLNLENPDSQNVIYLRAYGKKFIEFFESIGLEEGNKVVNQVSVPNWILKNKEYSKRCLRGLIDTDGSVYKRKGSGNTVINFKNRSKSLLNDFVEMCEEIEVKASKCGEYDKQIASQKEVEKFVRLVNPIKATKIEA